ncbi:Dabb family protein [Embleya hyalina]|uniref:Stress protein n=1 Tax=Embleya hyalina TaxID=516124 RepID=A0A401Z0A8_9ACTN|nr:Dabb family protein [Embleya hyalina]GCE00258.1 stress protein [Embleya hyalina]
MLLHLVLATWKPDVRAEDVAELAASVRRFADDIPEVLLVRAGADLELQEHNADFGMAAVFADGAALGAFAAHPAHLAVSRRLATMVASVTRLQFPLADDDPIVGRPDPVKA